MAAQDSQRKTERVPFSGKVRIRKPVALEGKGVDIAPGGIGVDVPQSIPEGSAVELELADGGAPLAGTVRVARPQGGGFRLGIQFEQEDSGIVARAKAAGG
jgi:hypothetical protein